MKFTSSSLHVLKANERVAVFAPSFKPIVSKCIGVLILVRHRFDWCVRLRLSFNAPLVVVDIVYKQYSNAHRRGCETTYCFSVLA